MREMFYAEVMGDYDCKNLQLNRVSKQDEWENIEFTLKKWKQYIEFQYIGISGIEPLDNPNIMVWLTKVRNIMTKSELVFITDGEKILSNVDYIKKMIELAPFKLCIVLPDSDWEKYLVQFAEMVKMTGHRFLKKGNNPINGYEFILISKQKKMDIELYHHVSINPKHEVENPCFLNSIGAPKLFEYSNRRKYMPILSDGKIFRCKNAYLLWKYWKEYQFELEAIKDYDGLFQKYQRYVKDSIISDLDEIDLKNSFLYESKLCSLCPGCVECVAHPKIIGQ